MADGDLTDGELEAAHWHGSSSGTTTPQLVRDALIRMVAEIRRRRAADLVGDEMTVLRQLRQAVGAANFKSAVQGAALRLIDRLIAGRGGA